MTPVRTLVVWCPDWPVVAAGIGPGEPGVVVAANRVVACSPAARAEGVRRGLRRREAENRCPHLRLVPADPDRDARTFEAVAAAVETLTPALEVVHPGTLALPTRGPSRYAGGDAALADRAAALAGAALPAAALPAAGGAASESEIRPRVGVADGLFAAVLAARRGVIVEPGGSAAFLAPLPVATLSSAVPPGRGSSAAPDALSELVELFRRLGLRTLGHVAAVEPADLTGRFGAAGARASRLCRGLDERPPRPRVPPPELTVAAELDPPAERVDRAAFVARSLAVELGQRLARRGLACARVCIEAETEHGEALARRWRTEGLALETALAERARWQIEGWLDGAAATRPTGGITLLRLVPEDVVADRGRQLGFWGGATAADERAARGLARVSGLLGPDAVVAPRRRGGRGPGDQIALVPAGGVGGAGGAAAVAVDEPRAAPWPGRLPAPSPALVHAEAPVAELVDGAGRPLGVTARGEPTGVPGRLSVAGGPWAEVTGWAGPWPVDERWWDEAARCRRARLQVV
ncbi:MAG: DNA polymerase Y family protein, partial [Actinobacteria bacterium]|nr:DNA polymerase Y family protein [Actinomycetota bacterium]